MIALPNPFISEPVPSRFPVFGDGPPRDDGPQPTPRGGSRFVLDHQRFMADIEPPPLFLRLSFQEWQAWLNHR